MQVRKSLHRYRWPMLGGLLLLLSIGLTAGGAFAGRLTDTTAGFAQPTNPSGTNLVISQIYGGAGCTTANCSTYKNDYVEIFNPTNAPISFASWSVQYNSAGGTGAWTVTPITGTISAGGYFLVAEAFNTNGINTLPTPDTTGSIAMAATAGKVALVSSVTALSGCPSAAAVVDLVGYGTTANCFEGSFAPAPSTTTADLRASGGCTDTDSNAVDFTAGAPNPRNSLSPINPCQATSTPTNTPPGPTNTPTNTVPPTDTPTFTNTPTSTPTHGPSTGVVISEFRTRGLAGGNDEFIELYNLSNSPVNIGGWKISGSSGCGTANSTRVTIAANLMHPSHSHFLETNSTGYSGIVVGDQTYNSGITDNGGIALLDASNIIIDAVGMCTTTTYYEGTPLAPMTASVDQSYERLPGGALGNGQDTNDNTADFFLNASSSNPQNLASPPQPPNPTDTPTPVPPTDTPTDTNTPVPTDTPTPVPPTNTPTDTPTPQTIVQGHVTWEGRPAQPNALQALPISLTLKSGATEVDYTGLTTDSSGNFSVNVGALPGGVYSWRVKGSKFLANSGSFALVTQTTNNVEMGLMLTGDCNNDNTVSIVDVGILRATFNKSSGDPGYDDRADLNGDLTVNVSDYNLLRANFGRGGAPPIRPGAAK